TAATRAHREPHMPAPATADELLDLTRKSGLIDPDRLDGYVGDLRASGNWPAHPRAPACPLARDRPPSGCPAEKPPAGERRGVELGKYRVLDRIGAGGMGVVYLCEHAVMKRRVAVKVLPAADADNPVRLERFRREARAAAVLDHPNIVRAHDIDEANGLHF